MALLTGTIQRTPLAAAVSVAAAAAAVKDDITAAAAWKHLAKQYLQY